MLRPRPLNITFVIYTLETFGGAERATTLVANSLAELGHGVSILTTWGRESRFALHPAVRVHALQEAPLSFRKDSFRQVLRMRAHLRRETPDVLVGAETSVMLLALPASAGLPVRRVGWEHFNFNTAFNRPRGALNRWRLARRLTARLADAVVVLTRRDAELWRAGLPGLRARLAVVANPLPFAPPPANPYRPEHRVVLAVGRLTEQKGFDLLLEAWARVEAEFPEWTLRVVGGAGEEEANLKAQALHAGLARVQFAGQTGDMHAEYAAAGLYCLSSRYEGLPMVLLECLAFGLPLVAFDCETGPREIIRSGENGVLVPPGDTAALADALRAVMSDPGQREAMSGHNYRMAGDYGAQKVVRVWEDLLTSLVPARENAAEPLAPG